jgi:predicted DNA-binding transcriptional regulator AlpA
VPSDTPPRLANPVEVPPANGRLPATAEPAPLLVPDTVAAALAGVSRSHWWRLHAAGKTPAAVKLGRKVLWNRAELVAWIDAACPSRVEWEARKSQARRYPRVVS